MQSNGAAGRRYFFSLWISREEKRKTSSCFGVTLGRVDILVNSAEIAGATAAVREYPVESWLQVINVNLNGTFCCCRKIVPTMREQEISSRLRLAAQAISRKISPIYEDFPHERKCGGPCLRVRIWSRI